MGLNKISIDKIGAILEKILSRYHLFFDYKLTNKSVENISSPTKFIEFNFTFISEMQNRWFYIRLQDFFSHQKIMIFINFLDDKKNVNLDIQNFYINELKNNSIKQKLIFKAKSEFDLEKHLESIFKYLIENSNEQLLNIIGGKTWVDIPFEWGEYK